MKFARKLCSLLLAIMMVMSACPVTALAAEPSNAVSVDAVNDFVRVAVSAKGKTKEALGLKGEWCAFFVGYCINHSKIKDKLGTIPSSYDLNGREIGGWIAKVKNAGTVYCASQAHINRWLEVHPGLSIQKINKSTFIPKPGDIIEFSWEDWSEHVWSHVAIVVSVDKANRQVTYIDGNSNSDGGNNGANVAQHTRSMDMSSIIGYVRFNTSSTSAPTTYSVTYNANGGSGAPSAQTKTKDVSLTLSTTRPTRAGYNFLGWATSSSAVSAQYQPGSTYTGNANVTLYAVWEELNTIAINEANFPDANFRTVVSTFDKNGDGKLNDAEIAAVTVINCSKKNISSLKGIEYFTALERLLCGENQLTTLDVSNNTVLKILDCDKNQLTTLDVSNNAALTGLFCYNNQLTALDVSKNTALTTLHCWGNPLTNLDVSKNTKLGNLSCSYNQLTALDVSRNTALKELYCHENHLTTLDVSKNTALMTLWCHKNQLTTLDVSRNMALEQLICGENQLTALDVSKNTALTSFGCENNSYDITLNVSRSYDLSKLPGSFNASKAKAWNGCTIQGSIIKVNAGVNKVSYTYDCGNGKTMPVTLNVVGVEAPTTYSVIYNANGGSGAPSAQTKTKDVSLTLSMTRPTREGYNFLGWATSASATSAQYQPGSTYTANANVTLYAVWEELNTIAINAANFPDANFRAVVSTFDKNGDEQLDETEIAAVTEIDCSGKNISSLKGIGCFTALTYLDCDGNQLTALDVSRNTALKWLFCHDNQLTVLEVSNNTALDVLQCGGNQLTALEVSKNTALTGLWCYENQLTALDVSRNTALTSLSCYKNQLTVLDVSTNTALTNLYCQDNQLTTLDVSKNTALDVLQCGGNHLTALDVSNNTALTNLDCGGNQLTALDVSNNTALTNLGCGGNQLTALDVSRNTALKWLFCNNNHLTALDVSNNTALTNLDCGGNQLTALDVSNNTALTNLGCGGNQLTTLDVSKNTALKGLDCYNNQLTTLDVSRNMALTSLGCDGNQLTILDVSKNTALTNLSCTVNQLTTLDVSRNTALVWLYCTANRLTTLDVSKNTALKELHCEINQLTALDVSKNTALTKLECESNSYDITLNANRSYDLSKLPGSFDASKAKSWNGCTIQGSIIKVNAGVNEVSYTYDCGNGKTMPVTLNVVGVEAPATYSVRFNANGGYGSMAAVSNVSGLYTLPSCTFEAPSGKQFKGWAVSPNGNVITGNSYNITADTTFYAVWEQQEVTGCCLEVGKMVATHGKEVLVPISISQNPGFAGINVKIDYDKTRLQFIGSGDIAGLDWTVNTGDNAGAVMVSTKNYTKNGEILLLKFKVLEDAPDGFAKVSLFNVDVLTIDEKPISVTVSSGGVEVITRLPGDVTGDGVIDTRDALRLKKHLAGMDAPIVWQNADVTGDNDVTLADLLRLMKYLAGMQVELV